jgi:sugar lactone lactonase YvrE
VTGPLPTLHPRWAVPGGRVDIFGTALPVETHAPPRVFVADRPARVLSSSPARVRIAVPADAPGGSCPVRVEPGGVFAEPLLVARSIATGLHQVDNPAFDGLGRLYVTHSGSRGVKVPVPLYRVRGDGGREPIAIDLANPTSLVLGPDGAMYVSSRFEGHVYRLTADDRAEVFASDLGVATGLAFDRHGDLYVGDRSGTIFRITADRQVETFAQLPASVAAFHLAFGPDEGLYVAAPTLSSHDPVYRVGPDRRVDVYCDGFGRPQGLAFDRNGDLYVVDALAGAAGLYRVAAGASPPTAELVLTAPALVGVAFDPEGGLIVASNDTAWRLDVPLTPLVLRG